MKIDLASTKGKIIKAAIELFPEKGYDNTSMKKIAELAGVTKPAVYYYFENKEEMFKEIIKIGQEHGLARVRDILESDSSFKEKLIALVLARFTIHEKSPEVEKFISWANTNGLQYVIKICKSKEDNSVDRLRELLIDFLKKEIDGGTLKSNVNAEQLLALLAGGINYHTKEYYMMGKDKIGRNEAKDMIDVLLYENVNNKKE